MTCTKRDPNSTKADLTAAFLSAAAASVKKGVGDIEYMGGENEFISYTITPEDSD